MNNLKVMLLTGGHWFDETAFYTMIDELTSFDVAVKIDWTIENQPQAIEALRPENVERFDAIVFYDMPGVTYTNADPPFEVNDPPDQFQHDFRRLLDSGKGLVFLHHAICSWPTWDEYAEAIGGRFHFLPGKLDGKDYPGSGYRFRFPQTITVRDVNHPIVEGIADQFSIKDEIYLYPVMEEKIFPLLESDATFESDHFFHGGVNFKEHPKGSNLAAWTKVSGNAPVAYLQFGHGPQVYQDSNYRKLIVNAIKWASSAEARQWALDYFMKLPN